MWFVCAFVCWLLHGVSWLLFAECVVVVALLRCVLLCCLLSHANCVLFDGCCLMVVVRCVLVLVCCVLFVVRCLICVGCWLLFV